MTEQDLRIADLKGRLETAQQDNLRFQQIIETLERERTALLSVVKSTSEVLDRAMDAIGNERLSDETGTVPLCRAISKLRGEVEILQAEKTRLLKACHGLPSMLRQAESHLQGKVAGTIFLGAYADEIEAATKGAA